MPSLLPHDPSLRMAFAVQRSCQSDQSEGDEGGWSGQHRGCHECAERCEQGEPRPAR